MQPILPYKLYTVTLGPIKPKLTNKKKDGRELIIISSK